jgi:energy-coupling factor transport system ATP-binding protein
MTETRQPIIEVQDLTVSYGADPAVEGLSLAVETGEWLLITGPSGCGKSTLARTISGLIPHQVPARLQGRVRAAGLDLAASSLPEISRQVGMVFQNPGSQLFHLSVEEELAFGPRNAGLPEDEVWERVDWALQQVGIQNLREERPDQLSGGQKQLTALAAVLALRPRVLVLDEPTASLDMLSTRRVLQALRRINHELGTTLIMIEHRLPDLQESVDRVVVMDRGRLVLEGSPEEVFSDPVRRQAFGLRRLKEGPLSRWEDLVVKNGRAPIGEEPLLELRGITAGYGGKPMICGVDLAIYPGDFTALVGGNGAGKSTLALTAAGLIKPQAGEVVFAGGKKPRPGLDVAVLFQNPTEQLFADTVEEEVAFAPRNYACFEPEAHRQVVEETGLKGLTGRRPTRLSVGQQLRTALAACLSIRPRLVILDEPTLGQDWGHLSSLMSWLEELNARGTAVLLISHDYKLVHHYARRVVLMEGGRITLTGRFREQTERSEL